VGSYLETEAIAYKLCSDYMYQVGTRLQEKTSFMITGSTSLADFVSLPVENADGGILNCWKVQSSFDGLYVGYMEPFGVSVPFLDIGSDGEINNMSIPVTFRMEETECGYRLFSVQTE